MGKGDKKTKRGKIIIGSYGVSRQRVSKNSYVPSEVKVKLPEEAKQVVPAIEEEKIATSKKKPATKKPAAKEVDDTQLANAQPEQKKAKKPAAKKVASSEEIQFEGTTEEVKD